MTNSTLLSEDDLKNWSGYRHKDALVNWLRQHKVPYWIGNQGRICCTLDGVNNALMRVESSAQSTEIEF